MVFQSKKELFHDIPTEKAKYSLKHYPRGKESFVKFYYEEALPEADTMAEGKVSYSIRDPKERQKSCESYFPGCLREKIDKWLEKKAPVAAFPKAGYEKIMMGLEMKDFDIFKCGYMDSLKEDMNSGIRMLNMYKYEHRGVFQRRQRGLLKSAGLFLMFMVLIVFDVPYLLVRLLNVVWEMMMPMFSLFPDTRIFGTPFEAGYIPLVLMMAVYWLFSVWMTMTKIGDLPDGGLAVFAPLGSMFLHPLYLLMREITGTDFLQGMGEILEAIAVNMDNGTFMIVICVLEVIVYKLFVMMPLVICYLGTIIQCLAVFLYRNLFKKKEAEAEEEKEVLSDIRSQWDFYVDFRKELRNADRQLKFMDMWNQSARGKGHFPGWFNIYDYVNRAENALLKENRARIRELEQEERKNTASQDAMRKSLRDKLKMMKKQEEELAAGSQVTDMNERNQAMVRLAVTMKDRENMDLNRMYDDLAIMLGCKNLWSLPRCPEKWPGEKEYIDGLRNERKGQYYEEVKENYEKAAWQGHILALARLANVYELDYNINSDVAYGEDISLQQWEHPLETEAEEARQIMGLTPDSLTCSLLRRAKMGKDDFDCEMLYNLAVHCQRDKSLKKEFKELVFVFVGIALGRQVKREDSDTARAAYYLAMLNYRCLGDKEAGRLWAEVSAEKDFGAAMYFLYDNQMELGIARKEGDGYCYEAWENRYPPARVCRIWDHQKEESRKYTQRELNKARSEADFERKQQEKKDLMEAYEKKLRDREKIFNAFVHDCYMDDDGAYISGKMSLNEYMDSDLYREDKMRDYEQKVDRELR